MLTLRLVYHTEQQYAGVTEDVPNNTTASAELPSTSNNNDQTSSTTTATATSR
jgi:hypothetical protein